MMKIRIIARAISCFVLLSELSAQEIITDRPDQTESSFSVGKNFLQIEAGFQVASEADAPSNLNILAPTVLLRYGVAEIFEFRFVSQLEVLKNNDESTVGMSDLEVGFKVELFRSKIGNHSGAFLSHLVIPSGSDEISGKHVGTVNKLSIAHDLSSNVGLGYNVGYNYFGTGSGDLTYSLALGVGINDRFGIYFEPYGEIVDFDDFVANFDMGFTYLIQDNLQFDFSYGAGITDRMNYVAVGISWLSRPRKSAE